MIRLVVRYLQRPSACADIGAFAFTIGNMMVVSIGNMFLLPVALERWGGETTGLWVSAFAACAFLQYYDLGGQYRTAGVIRRSGLGGHPHLSAALAWRSSRAYLRLFRVPICLMLSIASIFYVTSADMAVALKSASIVVAFCIVFLFSVRRLPRTALYAVRNSHHIEVLIGGAPALLNTIALAISLWAELGVTVAAMLMVVGSATLDAAISVNLRLRPHDSSSSAANPRRRKKTRSEQLHYLRRYFDRSAPSMTYMLSGTILASAPIILFSVVGGSAQDLVRLSILRSVVGLMRGVVFQLARVLAGFVARRSMQRRSERQMFDYATSGIVLGVIGGGLSAGLYSFSDRLFAVVARDTLSFDLLSLHILIVAALLAIPSTLFQATEFYTGRNRTLRIVSVASASTLVLLTLLLGQAGIAGVCVAILVSEGIAPAVASLAVAGRSGCIKQVREMTLTYAGVLFSFLPCAALFAAVRQLSLT